MRIDGRTVVVSQRMVGLVAGVQQTTVARWELGRGVDGLPHPALLKAWVRAVEWWESKDGQEIGRDWEHNLGVAAAS